ncbi:amidase [Mangrovicoccus algicola]|uniref:Amidase n=1 Tax=Mangrovicoccus algicola TaxID=2771008 RepID=A0A8J6YWC8_9RHOB|nr:amidase family protein [Mangrovicoccus algicola]MBE3639100.1 amidase [Mangrovicoccus algicola]
MDEWRGRSAAELGRGIEAGRIDPVELATAFLEAAGAHEHGARIYARLTPERAMAGAEAAGARARAGLRRGLLDGVPLSWKDLFDTAGVATEAGSRLLEGRVPEADAAVLATATLGGSVCLGKTHMTELAFSGLGLNPMTATPPNVTDPALAPGGSSSGAAVSVGLGLAAGAIGSDTGGSVRVPAAWNNLVGLKTTAGRVPLAGAVPLAARFDTIGPICRTVEDAAELLALIEGGRPADLRGASLAGLRLAVLETIALDDLRDEPGRAFEASLARLSAAGARVERIGVPPVAEAMAAAAMLFPGEAYGTWGKVIEAAPERMHPPIRDRFRQGAGVAAQDFVAGWQALETLRRAYLRATAGYDAVVLPTAPILPPDAARLERDADYFRAENLLALRNTRIANLMGLCALSLPTGTDCCGLMLMAGPGAEERLMRIGHAAEAALT